MRLATLDYDGFDWDEGNTGKVEERVAIEVVEDFFKQKILIKEDTRHSLSEERFLAMGYTKEGRCFFVAYTIRTKGAEKLIRPISARYTHKKEEEAYEAEIKKLQEK
jgi:uncharacterized DUF497 family protein